jgi:hypothetical protein
MPLNCKKCNGPHLTIKCGKDTKNNYNKSNVKKNNFNKNNFNKNNFNKNNFNKNNFNKNNFSKNKYCVRISNIPNDLTIKELNDLMQEWGDIGKINFNNSTQYKSAFVDFYIKDEAEYFVEALNKTPFDSYIIDVELLKK